MYLKMGEWTRTANENNTIHVLFETFKAGVMVEDENNFILKWASYDVGG
jgi:hypothetical protein